ncbi:sensor histidine kinase [Glycomyces arizonensis]|uniref:sensor histidine kinase n=1 Tax=Glycomyces arizonensis TaxID=256035 RepID=UPI00047E26B8|nr:sensor histidine kinase [Glycomyces arizonensis]
MSAVAARGNGFEHPALFYAGADEYLSATVPFIEGALSAGEPVAAAVPKRNLARLREALGPFSEKVLLIDMAEAGANPGTIIPSVLRAFADAHTDQRVHIIGEPIWPGRTELEYPACVQHEALINRAFSGRHVTILCPYDLSGLAPRVIADARATHPVLIDRTGSRTSDRYDPDRITTDYNRPLEPAPKTAIERAADRTTLDNARWFVVSYGRRVGLADFQLVDLEIAVTELLTNSIHHGGGIGTFRLWTDDTHLICDVSDAGHISDPLAGRLPVRDDQRHGRGLVLVNRIADLVRMHTGPGGTTVRVYLRLGNTRSETTH